MAEVWRRRRWGWRTWDLQATRQWNKWTHTELPWARGGKPEDACLLLVGLVERHLDAQGAHAAEGERARRQGGAQQAQRGVRLDLCAKRGALARVRARVRVRVGARALEIGTSVQHRVV